MSIFYRVIIILLVLGAGYSLFGIGHFHWLYYRIHNPTSEFTTRAPTTENSEAITLTEFLGYKCSYCRTLHPIMMEALDIRKDVRYTVRPIEFEDDRKPSVARLALAAGLQGKFWEFHEAFLEKPDAAIPDSFVEEICLLYDVDYDQLIADANGKKVEKMMNDNMKALDYALLNSVPSFIINHDVYAVDQSFPDLKTILNLITNAQ